MNLKEKFNDLKDYFSPMVIGEVNDVYVKIAMINGNRVPWHNHPDEDEMFYIVEGRLLFEIKGEKSFWMEEGDLFIVKKGINHKVSSTEDCKILLIENKTTEHTGKVKSDITKTINQQIP